MATLTKKEQAWLNELQDVLDRCPSPKKIGFYTIGDKSIYLYDLRRMDEIMEALDNRSSMDWCVAVHDMNAGFDEVFNLYSPLVYETGDIIDTYVYRVGLTNMQYSFGTAVGMFKSVISFLLLTLSYKLADRFAGYRIF